MDPEYDWLKDLQRAIWVGKKSGAYKAITAYIESLIRDVQEWTDAASDNGTAFDLACDQLAAMGHEEGGPEFMEDWRDLFMGQVAGAKVVIRDALNNCAGDEDDRCFYSESANPNKVAACPCSLPCEEPPR